MVKAIIFDWAGILFVTNEQLREKLKNLGVDAD